MSIEKLTITDSIQVLSDNTIQVREAINIVEDGKIISFTYHRYVLVPGDNLDEKDAKVVAIANLLWTPEVITAYKNAQISKEQL